MNKLFALILIPSTLLLSHLCSEAVDSQCAKNESCKEYDCGECLEEVPCHLPVETYFNRCYGSQSRGFWFGGGGNTFRSGGNIEIDNVSFFQHSNNPCNFRIRRTRLIFEGTFQNTFRYYIRPLWSYNALRLEQGYMETMRPDFFKIRFGLFKEPFSLEAIREDLLVDFNERALWIRNFLSPYDTGLMFYGILGKGALEYRLGVFNGTGFNIETNSKKEWVGRIVLAPFLLSERFWKQTYFGVSGSVSRQQDIISGTTYTTAADTIFWEWGGTSAAPLLFTGMRKRFGADFEYYYRSFAAHTEYFYGSLSDISQTKGKITTTTHLRTHSYYVEASFILTGETKVRDQWVIPFHNFDLCGNGGGAWEIAVRFESLRFNSDPLIKKLAIGTKKIEGYIVGINWYFNPYTELKIDYEHFKFSNSIEVTTHKIDSESVLITRLQCEF